MAIATRKELFLDTRSALFISFQPALQSLFASLSCINSVAYLDLGPTAVERRAGLQAVAQPRPNIVVRCIHRFYLR